LVQADILSYRPEPESVDVIMTSPPYKDEDGWTRELMYALGKVAREALRPGGRLFVNLGQLRGNYDRPMRSWGAIRTSGLKPGQTIAWVKSAVVPSWREAVLEALRDPDCTPEMVRKILEAPGRPTQRGHYTPITLKSPTLNYGWEFVFTFWKPPERAMDRLSIGVPHTDPSNRDRGTRGKHGGLHCAGDVWVIPYRTTGAKTKKTTAGLQGAYSFPDELARRAIKLCGLEPGSTVMDPFCGGGTVLRVARELGHDAVGIDLNREALKVAWKTWAG